jgi:hypothetical protein
VNAIPLFQAEAVDACQQSGIHRGGSPGPRAERESANLLRRWCQKPPYFRVVQRFFRTLILESVAIGLHFRLLPPALPG